MAQYNPSETEKKWQERWEKDRLYETDLSGGKPSDARSKSRAVRPGDRPDAPPKHGSRPKYYNLVMFPYPSGDRLHIGHWYNFGPADSWGRYMRMKGYNVFEPMGFDAFGLPAENHAIKTGTPPEQSTAKNTHTMVEQLKRIGTMYDWSKTLDTSRPDYYKWTQWLFLQMYKHGLAYKKEAPVNWCPSCQTVLANEQAQDGTCERCGTTVIQKPLAQWFWKITHYAQRLLDGLDTLDWPEKTKIMQRNWIGRSEGAEISFALEGARGEKSAAAGGSTAASGASAEGGAGVASGAASVKVFTTRPDTLFGATYMVLAPEHPLVGSLVTDEQRAAVEDYRKKVAFKTEMERTELEKEKTGVFTGGFAVNPVNGEKIPVWIADYVLMTYGTGAIMAVPGHDERDWEFARKFDLLIREVVAGGTPTLKAGSGGDNLLKNKPQKASPKVKNSTFKVFVEDGTAVNSEFLDGLPTAEAKKKMIAWLEEKGLGKGVINYRLRDWLISRQRYWGAPIPIVYDPEGNPHPIPEEHLPWLLPTDAPFKPKGTSPLGQSKELKARTEKIFGKGWTPEIDTMDTFVCSSFYYLRYLMGGSGGQTFVNPALEKNWMPVDMYIGGPEHACMHLIYARFVMMALKDFGFVSHEEPFQRLVHQGLVTHKGAKMSKSKGNVVSPDAFVEKYGSDVFRMYLMFMGPFTDGGDWNDQGITGISRFVDKLYGFMTGEVPVNDEAASARALHQTIKRVTQDIEKMQFNTAIAAMMEFLNGAQKTGLSADGRKMIVRLIAPFAPHLAEELWEKLGGRATVFNESWPEYDESLTVSKTVTLAVQVNGKVRGEVSVAPDISEEDAMAAAAAHENVARHLEGKKIVKKIYVPGKLVSFVVK